MPRILMNFQRNKNWIVHFIEADCKTTIGHRTRFFRFPTEEDFRAFVSRCNLEDMDKFHRSLAQWARGSNYCHLTGEQYQKLR
jgi:hypothetical protein